MNLEQSKLCTPRFTSVSQAPRGTKNRYEAFGFAYEYDKRFPRLTPTLPNETVTDWYGARFKAAGALDGADTPAGSPAFEPGGSVSNTVLFQGEGSIVLTNRRLIGLAVSGDSLISTIGGSTGLVLLFSLDLDLVWTVTVKTSLDRKRRRVDDAVHLWMEDTMSGVAIDVIGRMSRGPSHPPVDEVARKLVDVVAGLRIAALNDPVERDRVAAVRAGEWEVSGEDRVARIRHPDDVSAFVVNDEQSENPPRPEPAWYDAPGEAGYLRYWDGITWTEHRAPKA